MDFLLIRKPLTSENIVKYADGIDWAYFCSNGDLRLVSADSMEEVEDCLLFESLSSNSTITKEIVDKFKHKLDYSVLIRNATYFAEVATDEEVLKFFNIVKADNFIRYFSICLTQREMFDLDFITKMHELHSSKLNNGANNPLALFVNLYLSDFEKKNLGFRVAEVNKERVREKCAKLFLELYNDDKLGKSFKNAITSSVYNFNNLENWEMYLRADLLPEDVKSVVDEYINQEKLTQAIADDMIQASKNKSEDHE